MSKRNGGLYLGNTHIASIGLNSIENNSLIHNLLVGSGDISTDMNLGEDLDSQAFSNRDFSSINLPNVTSIDSNTFYNCSSLTTANLPNATSIGDYAFYGCTSLTEINIPGATNIGDHVFRDCTSLAEVNLPNVTDISDYAFYGCTSLTEINIPGATSIGTSSFDDCTSLAEVNFPNATSISNHAFYGCSSLTTANLPNVTSIGDNAFHSCSSLTVANFPNVTSIGDTVFRYCTSLVEVNIPNITSIDTYTFYNCTSLTTVNFPNVTSIGESAFERCTSLTAVDFPNATSIDYYAFDNVGASLTTANLPNVTSIGGYAFRGCTSLTNANINISNITNIGYYAFDECALLNDLKDLSFYKLESLGTGSFHSCSQIEKVDIPWTVKTLPASVFYNCASLECLVLRSPTQVTCASNTLTGTPLKSGVGFVYVPAALIESYEADSNWSGCVFRALEDYPDVQGYVWEQRYGGEQYVESAWSANTTSSTYTSTSSSVYYVGTSYTFNPTTGKFTIDNPTTKTYSTMNSTSYVRSASSGEVSTIYKYSSKTSRYSYGSTRYYIYWKTKTATLQHIPGTEILNATFTTANRDAYISGGLNEDGYTYIRLDANGSPEYDTGLTNET